MKDIRLEWQIDIDSTTTLVVEGIIDVIEELVANSQVHAFMAGNGGTVRILMYANAGGVVLEYRDDGKGPIGVDRSRVFAPFYTTARSEGHMGLGLNIIQNTVHGLYRGKCTLLPGPGFALRIELPCKVSGTAS